jgi:2,3-bisphosphoglycerate-dependent phosphoglycerate mutase/probable phosphoglycerate mutase
LSAAGIEQARLTARHLSGLPSARLYSSPLRRARETAEIIAGELGLAVRLDDRLRERMNWGDGASPQTRDAFLVEWDRATRDRDFAPSSGDSSRAAGARLASLLDDLARQGGGDVALVTHGGVTVDLLRNLFADEVIRARNPDVDAITSGVPGCAITHLVRDGDAYELRALASVAHLPSQPH